MGFRCDVHGCMYVSSGCRCAVFVLVSMSAPHSTYYLALLSTVRLNTISVQSLYLFALA
jgi:hypothetical protein